MSTVKARLKQNMRLKIPTLIVNFVISGTKSSGFGKVFNVVYENLHIFWKNDYSLSFSGSRRNRSYNI